MCQPAEYLTPNKLTISVAEIKTPVYQSGLHHFIKPVEQLTLVSGGPSVFGLLLAMSLKSVL